MLVLVVTLVSLVAPLYKPEEVSATTCATSGNNVSIASCTFDAGTYTYTGTLTLGSGVIIDSNTGDGQVVLVSDNITVTGTVDGTGYGYPSGTGPGTNTDPDAGAGYGGNGGVKGEGDLPGGGDTYGSVRQPTDMGSGASGGGAGGASLKLQAPSGTVTINNGAWIRMRGAGGAGNGGAGGSVWINSDVLNIVGAGEIDVRGGQGCNDPTGYGGGGGGRVSLEYNSATQSPATANINVMGGAFCIGGEGTAGGSGTLFYDDKNDANVNGHLIVRNNTLGPRESSKTTQVTDGTQTYDTILFEYSALYVIPNGFKLEDLESNGNLGPGAYGMTIEAGGEFAAPSTYKFDGVGTIVNNGTISGIQTLHMDNSDLTNYENFDSLEDLTLSSSGVYRHANGSDLDLDTLFLGGNNAKMTTLQGMPLTINATNVTVLGVPSSNIYSYIDVSGLGHEAENGSSPGGSVASAGAGGGAHGGTGGTGSGIGGTGGTPAYDDPRDPSMFGSGGGHSNGTGGGAGGGALFLNISGNLNIHGGRILANGVAGVDGGGGGAGGTIRILTNTMSSSGGGPTASINADGGGIETGTGAGCGAGGRVLVLNTGSNTSSSTYSAGAGGPGCSGGQSAAAGTVVRTPATTSVSPHPTTTVVSGAGNLTLTVNGSNFSNGISVVRIDGVDRTTTFVSSSQVTASIPASDRLTAGTRSVTVHNSDLSGGLSNAQTWTINNPVPTLSSISPDFGFVGDGDTTITLSGTNFRADSLAYWNGFDPLAVTFISATTLEAVVPTGYLATSGTFSVHVENPAPGGGTTMPKFFTVYETPAVLDSIDPTSEGAGRLTDLVLTVAGSNFDPAAEVIFAGDPMVTTFIDSTEMTAVIPASYFASPASYQVTVLNPDSVASDSMQFDVTLGAPTLDSIDPTTANVFDGDTTLDLYGSNFYDGYTEAYFNGNFMSVTFIDDTHIQALIPDNYLTGGGTFDVFVQNPAPGGGISASEQFTVVSQAPTLDSAGPDTVTANSGAQNIAVFGNNFNSTSVVRFDGSDRVTTYNSINQLTVSILSGDVAGAGIFSLVVFNPGGGGLSNAISFYVIATDWTAASTPTVSISTYKATAYGSGVAVGVGDGGADNAERAIRSTDDGATWSLVSLMPSAEDYQWHDVVYDADNDQFVAIGGYYDGVEFTGASMISTDGGQNWTAYVASTHDHNLWEGIAYYDGLYVASGTSYDEMTFNYTPVMAYSSDGINWSAGTVPPGVITSFAQVTVNAGRWVAVGNDTVADGNFIYSDDGINWTYADSPLMNGGMFSVTYGGGRFVATGNSTFAYSTDGGETWALGNEVWATTWIDVAFGDGFFVAVGDNGGSSAHSAFSADGVDWYELTTPQQQPPGTAWYGVIPGSGNYIAVGNTPDPNIWAMYTPMDLYINPVSVLTAFDPVSALENGPDFTLTVEGSDFVDGAEVLWNGSPLPTTFIDSANLTAEVASSYLNDEGLFPISVQNPGPGGGQSSSIDFTVTNVPPASDWVIGSAPDIDVSWSDAAYGEGRVVVVAQGGNANERGMYSDDDGATWTVIATPDDFDHQWAGVTYGNGMFVAVGWHFDIGEGDNVGSAMYSADGITWTVGTVPNNELNTWQGVTFGEGRFVAVGSYNDPDLSEFGAATMYSDDGSTWTEGGGHAGTSSSWFSVAFGNGNFVAVGNSTAADEQVIYSDDGISWNFADTPTTANVAVRVTYGDAGFVAVGSNHLITSPDGLTWTQGDIGFDSSWSDVTFADGYYVVVGEPDSTTVLIAYSADGVTWGDSVSPLEHASWRTVVGGASNYVTAGESGSTNAEDAIYLAFDSFVAGPVTGTTQNRVVMSRLKVGATADVTINFHMTNEHDGGVTTVTFPAEFTILGAPTTEGSDPCFSNFAFDNTAKTVSATKDTCGGDVDLYLGGFQVVNPGTPGSYMITWENDDPGGGPVPITLEDQINVSATVDPYITFRVVASTDPCLHGVSGSVDDFSPTTGSTVAFGTLSPLTVASSDGSGSSGTNEHICTAVSTNAGSGYVLSTRSTNGGLYNGSQYINSNATETPFTGTGLAAQTAVGGTERYGICLSSVGGEINMDTSAPAGFNLTASGNYGTGGSCTSSSAGIVPLSQDTNIIGSNSGPVQDGMATWRLKASISSVTGAGSYSDVLTFVATGTY